MQNVNTLVTVAGHATFLDSVEQAPADPTDERHWYLQSFQRGEIPFYIGHMRRGAELVAANPRSLGLMSGGRTRLAGGHWSEAASYLAVAEHFNYWQPPDASTDVRDRFDTEVFAKDSLENVLYSVMRYRRIVGRLPLQVIMAGWEPKRSRFEHHARTLGIPKDVFAYDGVAVTTCDGARQLPDMDAFAAGEHRALEQWRADPLGEQGALRQKRQERNPFQIAAPYTLAEYVEYAREEDWRPSQEVLAAAALLAV